MSETNDVTGTVEAAPRVLAPPSACGDEMEQIDWVDPFTVSVGEFLVGIRTNSHLLTDLLAAALESHRRVEPMAPAYYSLKLGGPSRRRANPMHYLYVGGHVVFGSRDLARIVDALLGRLSMHAMPSLAGPVFVRGVPVMSNEKILLAPPELLAYPAQIDRTLFKKGIAVGTHEFVAIDVDGFLHLPASNLDLHAPSVTASQLEQVAPVGIEPSLTAAPWRLDHWLVEVPEGAVGVFDNAHAVLHGAQQIRLPLPIPAQQALEQIETVMSMATASGFSWQTPEELCDLVVAAVMK